MKRVMSFILVLAMMIGMIPDGLAQEATPAEPSQEQSQHEQKEKGPLTEAQELSSATVAPVINTAPSAAPTEEATATSKTDAATSAAPEANGEAQPTPEPIEQPTPENVAETTLEPTAQIPSGDESQEPEANGEAQPTPENAAETTLEPTAQIPSGGESQGPEAEAFIPGYAKLSAGTKLYTSAALKSVKERTAEEGIVFAYALDENNAEAIAVWFAVKGQVDDAWVSAERVEMLDEKETERYLSQADPASARVPQHDGRFLLADVVLKTKENETTAPPAPAETAEPDETTETVEPAETAEPVEVSEPVESVETMEPAEMVMAAPAMLAAPLAVEPITLTIPEGPYFVGESYKIGVSIPGAQAYTVTWISEGNEYCSAYQDTVEFDLTDGQGSFDTFSWWALAETIIVESEVGGQKKSKSVDITYGSDTTGPAVQLSAGEVLVDSEVVLTADVGSAENVMILKRYNGVSGLYSTEWESGRLKRYYYLSEAGSYTYACMVYQNGHWSIPGPAATVSVISYGEVEATELQGVPQGAWQAGKDLTLTYTPAAHSDGYYIDVYDEKNEEYLFGNSGYRGTITLDGDKLTEGTYTLRFSPWAEKGYTVSEDAEKTYTLVVEGVLSDAPVVVANAMEAWIGEEVSFTVTAPGATKLRLSRTGWMSEEIDVTSDETTQTLTLYDDDYEKGIVHVKFSAMVDGVWTDYCDPIDITVKSLGQLGNTMITVSTEVVAGEDFDVSWSAVENAQRYSLILSRYEGESTKYVDQMDCNAPQTSVVVGGSNVQPGRYKLTLWARADRWMDGTGSVDVTVKEGSRKFTYEVSDGKATITGYVSAEQAVVVPSEIDGYPVTKIGHHAFSSRNVTSVELPSSIVAIGANAFRNCDLLEKIEIGPNVNVDSYAFSNCDRLTVYGYTGSLAQEAAQKEGCGFVSIGELAEGPAFTVDKLSITKQSEAVFTITAPGATKLRMHGEYGSSVEEFDAQGDTTVYTKTFYNTGVYSISFSALIDGTWSKQGLSQTITVSDLGTLKQTEITAVDRIEAGAALEVNWTVVENAEEYRIRIDWEGTNNDIYYKWVNDGSTSVTIPENELPQGAFEIRIDAYAAGWNSSTAKKTLTVEAPQAGKEFVYTVNSDGTITITRYLADAASLSIPGQIDGYAVSMIDSYAFESSRIASVTIPDGIALEYNAFSDCDNLMDVYMPRNSGSISSSAFVGSENVKLHVYRNSTAHTMAIAKSIPFEIYDEEPEASGITATVQEGPYYINEDIEFTVTVPSGTERLRMYIDGEAEYGEYSVADTVTVTARKTFYDSQTKTHYVQFSALVGGKWTTLSDALTLEVICFGKLAVPVVTLPEEVNAGQDLTISWTPVEHAQEYYVSLYWLDGTNENWLCGGNTAESSYTIQAGSMSRVGTIRVKVRAEAAGWGDSAAGESTTQAVSRSDWAYTDSYWNGLTITGYLGAASEAVIPDEIGGSAVKTVGNNAFEKLHVESVTLGQNVTRIESYAFKDCANLKKVVIPAGVTSIGDNAFENCPNVTIYGYADTMAQSFAQAQQIPFVELTGAVAAPEFTLEPENPLIKETVKVKVENTQADRIRVYLDDYLQKEADVTDGKAQVELWRFYEVGTHEVRVSGRVNGIWSAKGEAKTFNVSLAGVLNAPVVEEIGTQVPRTPFRIRWAPVENATSYWISIRKAGDSQVGAYSWSKECVDEEGYCYFQVEDTYLIEAGSYVATVGADAEAGYESVESQEVSFEAVLDTDWLYTVGENGVTITGYVGSDTSVTVPEQIEGRDVIAIGEGAFAYDDDLTSVVLPDTVVDIGAKAFEFCYALESVQMPANLESIGEYAFNYCQKLKEIELLQGLTSIGAGAFYMCRALGSVDVPDSVKTIGTDAFNGCEALTSVSLPELLDQKELIAFNNCERLQSIVMSKRWAVLRAAPCSAA